MDRMLVVVFDGESKAYEGKKALLQLDGEGSITAYGYAVVAKNSDGTTSVRQGDDSGPLGTLTGTALGSFIGLLAGPVGLAVGAVAGLTAGVTVDLHNARISDDFIDDVTKVLLPKLRKTGRPRWTLVWTRSGESFSGGLYLMSRTPWTTRISPP